MNETTLLNTCPKCGAALPSAATSGLCPRCLMAEAMLPTKTDPAPSSFGEIVTPAELSPHFPQLEILECLGRGGMGVVYKARQKTLNRLVALKLLAPERAHDTAFAERFVREAQALAALNHPSIVTIYDFGQAGGFFFLLMEFVDGVNLRQAMKAGRFTPEQALAIVPPVCEALQYAHEHGIVHRDIKPENLLLDKEGRVKIADFGIAKIIGRDADTPVREGMQTGASASLTAGTPQYMAPEQKEHRVTDHRADIYSLGVVLYEMLTGVRPKEDLVPPSKRVQVDVRIDEIVLRALEKTPELRFATAAEFRTQVENLATPAGVESRSLKPWERSWLAWPEGKRAFLQGALFLLVLALTLGFGWIDREVVVSAPNPQTGAFQNEVRIHVGAGQPWLVEIERWTQDGRQSWPEFRSGTPSFFCGPAALAVWILLVRLVRVTQGPALIRLRTAPDAAGRSHVLWPNVLAAWLGAVAVASLGVLLLIAAMAAFGRGAPPVIPSLLLYVVPVSMLVFVGLRLPPAAKGVVAPPAASVGNSSPPRFSRMAIFGAVWFGVALVGILTIAGPIQKGLPWWQVLLSLMVLLPTLSAPFGTTILGWTAVGRIGRSAGKLYGLGLAVFDGVLFPLLALNGLTVWVGIYLKRLLVGFYANPSVIGDPRIDPPFITRLANDLAQNGVSATLLTIVTVLAILVVDFLIIRRFWRAVNSPAEASVAAVPAGSRSGCLRVIAILGVAVIALFAVVLSAYFLSGAPSPGTSASSHFPKIAHIGGNHHSVAVVHDDSDLHYVFYYAGDFGTSSSGSQNTHSLTWMDEGSIKLGNGRTFGYHRESTSPEHVRVNGTEYDLRLGRVLVLHDDGTVAQLRLPVSLKVARDPDVLAALISDHAAKPLKPIPPEAAAIMDSIRALPKPFVVRDDDPDPVKNIHEVRDAKAKELVALLTGTAAQALLDRGEELQRELSNKATPPNSERRKAIQKECEALEEKIWALAHPAASGAAEIVPVPLPTVEPRLQFRLVADANDADSEAVDSRDGTQQFRLRREVLLDDAAVADAKADGTGTETGVDVTFGEHAGKRFAEITGANVGKRIAIVLDGKVLSAPTIMSPITGGLPRITGKFTAEEAQAIAKALASPHAVKAVKPIPQAAVELMDAMKALPDSYGSRLAGPEVRAGFQKEMGLKFKEMTELLRGTEAQVFMDRLSGLSSELSEALKTHDAEQFKKIETETHILDEKVWMLVHQAVSKNAHPAEPVPGIELKVAQGQLEKTLAEVIELQAALAARRLEIKETHPAVIELQKKLNVLEQKAENLRALIRQSAPKQ